MLRRGEDLLGRAAFHNLTFMQDGDAVADSGDRRQIMRDIEDGHAGFAVESCEELEDFRLRDHVERTGGLIGEKQCGTVHDGHGNEHALRLTDA